METRTIKEVIEYLLEQVPASKPVLYDELNDIIKFCPDALAIFSENEAYTMSTSLGRHCNFPPIEDWEWNIAGYLSGRTIPEIKDILSDMEQI